MNAGELLYSWRPGVSPDSERSGRCYVHCMRNVNIVQELASFAGNANKYAVCARMVLVNAHEVATKQPPVLASSDAIIELRELHSQLEKSAD